MAKEFKDKLRNYNKQLRSLRSQRDGYGIGKYNEVRWEYLRLLEKQEANNRITRLQNRDGEWVEEEGMVQEVVVNYFENLFTASTNTDEISQAREEVQCVTDEQNDMLLQAVTTEEVRAAVFSMHSEKSPGPDGMNPDFFQAFWGVVGTDVTNFCQRFLNTGELPEVVNRTLVCLIPKVKNPKQMTDLRPISLLNVLVRIMSKVLSNRMKPYLKTLISDKQSAFIEGQLLTNNALLAFEINHCIKRRTQGGKGLAGLKLDVSKAYDRLEWCYIEGMLLKFGVNHTWIQRLMTCVRTVKYSFANNGKVFGDVRPHRGIRQGDPISTYIYIYILCAEGLSAMLRRTEEEGHIHGISIARGAPKISHLLFTDDCYLFFNATGEEVRNMKNILSRYEILSGQAISLAKSSITFSPNTGERERREVCENLQVQVAQDSGKYLRMPMMVGRKKASVFHFLTDRVKQKLQGWGKKIISKGGKATLLKSAAQTVPNFWMNLFFIPNEVCERIEVLMNRCNKWIWDKVNVSVFGLKAAAMNMLMEWKRAQQEKVVERGTTEASNAPRSWEKPPLNWVKINVDVALFGSDNCIGFGMIVRDAAGNLIMARSRK
ncbi:hypothetical protein AgCh_028856 [Apium graveolens]